MRLFKNALLLGALLLSDLAIAKAAIQIDNATVRQPLPGRTVSAGYFSITNQGQENIAIIAASSAWFGKTELHQHRMVDGLMRMEKIERIEVDAGQTVHLQPGGLHLMLFQPQQELVLDQQVPLEIQLASGESITISAVVTQIPKK